MDVSLEPRPHEEAAALIRGKSLVSREVFDGLLPELRGRAFTVTGLQGADVLQRVRESVASLPEGVWDEAKGDIVKELEPFLGDGADRRAETLLRTHGFEAFQAANWRVAQEDADTTHLQYLATEDSHVRDTHLALNGIVLPKDDPFWQDHYPPWEWGCRCRVRAMNPDLVDEARAEDENRAPDDQLVLEGPALQKLREGELLRNGQRYDVLPPENGFRWQPDDLRLPLDELRQRYDPEEWSAFEAWAKSNVVGDGRSVWEWLTG